MEGILLIDKAGKRQYVKSQILDFTKISSLNNVVRQKIIRYLAKKTAYASQIAQILKLNEQTVYYHFNELEKAGLIVEIERKQIRGTIAKKYTITQNSFSFILNEDLNNFDEKRRETPSILNSFITGGFLNAKIIVGNPEPHGPHKARARDGHYAIDLGVFLGNHANLKNDFSVSLDSVDVSQEKNLIIVGGPVTNLTCAKINKYLPCKFSDSRPWGIVTPKNTYTEESVGMIAKIKNPFYEGGHILVIAGIRVVGTKAAVIAITRNIERVIGANLIKDNFYAVVQGYDLDGDGKIDSIEVVERSD